MAKANEIKYLTAIKQEKRAKKFCRFKKYGIKYIDYKDAEFLKKFLNEQGKLFPRRLTGNSLKFQRKVSQAVKKARQMALLPYVTDLLNNKMLLNLLTLHLVTIPNPQGDSHNLRLGSWELNNMQVILIQDVDNLGGANELVTVKNGYARNFLNSAKKGSRSKFF